MVHRRPVYINLLNVPSFSSRYLNKIKRTSRLGRLLALSLEILLNLLPDNFSASCHHCGCTTQFVSDLTRSTKDRFSQGMVFTHHTFNNFKKV